MVPLLRRTPLEELRTLVCERCIDPPLDRTVLEVRTVPPDGRPTPPRLRFEYPELPPLVVVRLTPPEPVLVVPPV